MTARTLKVALAKKTTQVHVLDGTLKVVLKADQYLRNKGKVALRHFEIVDCTLRDGGYYTNWDFSKPLLEVYFQAVRSLPIKYVEVGYRSPEKAGYVGQFFHLNLTTLKQLKAQLRSDQSLAIMFNFKDMNGNLIDTLTSDIVGTVDLIRFACPPDSLKECIEYGRQIKAKGLKVAINVMYMTKYIDQADTVLLPLADAEDVVDYVALVDSYGGVMPEQAERTIAQAVKLLPQPIGYHGHDNLSLAFANSLSALKAGATMLDATFTGMGRGAGNLKTELIAVYREQQTPTGCHFGPLAKALEQFETMQKEYGWGTNLAYMVSGVASLPQANVMDWLGTRRYQMDSIVEALRLSSDTEFDNDEYPALETTPIANEIRGKGALIIGGGLSAQNHACALIELAHREDMVLVHSSTRNAAYFKNCDLAQIFCLAGQEFSRLSSEEAELFNQQHTLVLTTPPPRFRNSIPGSKNICQLSYAVKESNLQKLGPVTDEPPLGMAIGAAEAISSKKVYLAGFDGYSEATVSQQNNAQDVQAAINYGLDVSTPWAGNMASVTPTLYEIPAQSLYAKIQGKFEH
ncbi:hypothetical protein [Thioclava sp. GXIMD4216]|uniref:hypothetical protein n=1 Tax=Thioclava sp. GXIMD4216 TaxID=3131929 RepID=UPI0030D34150